MLQRDVVVRQAEARYLSLLSVNDHFGDSQRRATTEVPEIENHWGICFRAFQARFSTHAGAAVCGDIHQPCCTPIPCMAMRPMGLGLIDQLLYTLWRLQTAAPPLEQKEIIEIRHYADLEKQ